MVKNIQSTKRYTVKMQVFLNHRRALLVLFEGGRGILVGTERTGEAHCLCGDGGSCLVLFFPYFTWCC